MGMFILLCKMDLQVTLCNLSLYIDPHLEYSYIGEVVGQVSSTSSRAWLRYKETKHNGCKMQAHARGYEEK